VTSVSICFGNLFFTRVATVDVVYGRIVPRDSQLWAIQCTWSTYRTIEFATRARKIARVSDNCYMQQKGIVPSQRSLSCELQYKLSVL